LDSGIFLCLYEVIGLDILVVVEEYRRKGNIFSPFN